MFYNVQYWTVGPGRLSVEFFPFRVSPYGVCWWKRSPSPEEFELSKAEWWDTLLKGAESWCKPVTDAQDEKGASQETAATPPRTD
jgi:hypothetical protein